MNFLAIVMAVFLLHGSPPAYVAGKIQQETTEITFANYGAVPGNDNECTGVIVWASGHIAEVLTARHCSDEFLDSFGNYSVPNLFTMQLKTHDGNTGRVVRMLRSKYHGQDDIRLLEVRFKKPHNTYAAFSTVKPRVFDPLWIYGFPGPYSWKMQAASYIGKLGIKDIKAWDYDVAALCPECDEGDSGGGVWDNSGHLVGITNSSSETGNLKLGFFLPIDRIVRDLSTGE